MNGYIKTNNTFYVKECLHDEHRLTLLNDLLLHANNSFNGRNLEDIKQLMFPHTFQLFQYYRMVNLCFQAKTK